MPRSNKQPVLAQVQNQPQKRHRTRALNRVNMQRRTIEIQQLGHSLETLFDQTEVSKQKLEDNLEAIKKLCIELDNSTPQDANLKS